MKFLIKSIIVILLIVIGYFAFIYFVPYSEGVRAGELVKFSKKGVLFKTWEGEISQGVSEAQIFQFSVEKGKSQVIEDLNKYQGQFVKLSYIERYQSFFWLGDTKYFITKVEEKKRN
ncbi:6-phosphogluconate dehydrogenase [Mesoflavibacter sp. SCSIO 43206]|uniref:6-phosphogluconate dehydrogenase n=1 Tax=Mesoflavibacter sp. SCSIO 43206 TaxID=2779362 RepID=UPI001CA83A8E|nr:6-phosphogluconate dehydrogenase [Mesoflavibacter sp. SCSIO 43206]UAB75493.1 6-phosphogluconate dehydrogenase [Mesoflavibacter sp. SCSIO 43206]